jgi:hypothetical protein
MAIDITKLTEQELQQLSYEATARAAQIRAAQEQAELEAQAGRTERINGAVTQLTALLGPEGAPPYDPSGSAPPSIRGLLAYPPEVMAQNSGIALQMLFQGLEALTITTRDLAGVMSTSDSVSTIP